MEALRAALLVEDDDVVSECMTAVLSQGPAPYSVFTAPSIGRARRALLEFVPDVLVLDLCPGAPLGLDFLGELRGRRETAGVPVMVVTGSQSDNIVADCLKRGAGDFLHKPFDAEEFRARVDALVRKNGRLSWGAIALSAADHTATIEGRRLDLSKMEFALLERLLKDRGRVVKTESLLAELWGRRPEAGFKVDKRVLEVFIHHLRRKLGESGRLIVNVPRVGFRLSAF